MRSTVEMRDFVGVLISELVTDDDGDWGVIYTFDNVDLRSNLNDRAVAAVKPWCEDQFGPMGSGAEDDPRWYLSRWHAISFTNRVEATAFKMRWF